MKEPVGNLYQVPGTRARYSLFYRIYKKNWITESVSADPGTRTLHFLELAFLWLYCTKISIR